MTPQLHSWAFVPEKWKLTVTQKSVRECSWQLYLYKPKTGNYLDVNDLKKKTLTSIRWDSTHQYRGTNSCNNWTNLLEIMVSEKIPKCYIPMIPLIEHYWNDKLQKQGAEDWLPRPWIREDAHEPKNMEGGELGMHLPCPRRNLNGACDPRPEGESLGHALRSSQWTGRKGWMGET